MTSDVDGSASSRRPSRPSWCPCPTDFPGLGFVEDDAHRYDGDDYYGYGDRSNFGGRYGHDHNSRYGDDDASSPDAPRQTPWPFPSSHRRLGQGEGGGETWEMIYVGFVLLFMFVALLSDRIGADMVMITSLAACMAAGIVTVQEGVSGFSNEGVLTVLALFVVAAGIQRTGGLDWYMGKLLGRPGTVASAQLRIMIPIGIVSAFLNNTPVVVVMIPIVQKWGRNMGMRPSQMLMPLSFASILGGTCTLIGTSTNLVIVGLLAERYPGDASMEVGLFDLGEYGVPIAIVGVAYILLASPFLLPGGARGYGGKGGGGGGGALDGTDASGDTPLLLGARLTRWSPAAGRSVERSGLRDTGGIYLVSVHRAETGNVHRAVGRDFVLNVDDVLYFTGSVETFGDFCEEHGCEVVTNEVHIAASAATATATEEVETEAATAKTVTFASIVQTSIPGTTDGGGDDGEMDRGRGEGEAQRRGSRRKRSPSPKGAERDQRQSINRMTDMIRGFNPSKPQAEEPCTSLVSHRSTLDEACRTDGPAIISILSERGGGGGGSRDGVSDNDDDNNDAHSWELIIVGVNASDRPGLLLDISKALHNLGLQLHHTEATVRKGRSISIWRCEVLEGGSPIEEIRSLLHAMLEIESGAAAVKTRGLAVIRAVVTEKSRLSDKRLSETPFRETYGAAIVAVQKRDKTKAEDLTTVVFATGDLLVLQANDGSPLLMRPPPRFYSIPKRKTSFGKLANAIKTQHKAAVEKMQIKTTIGLENSKANSAGTVSIDTGAQPPDVQNNAAGAEEDDNFFISDNSDSVDMDDHRPNDDGRLMSAADESFEAAETANAVDTATYDEAFHDVWTDLRVLFHGSGSSDGSPPDNSSEGAEGGVGPISQREYLTAVRIPPNSSHVKKTVGQVGLDKLSGLHLVQIERLILTGDGGGGGRAQRRGSLVVSIPTGETEKNIEHRLSTAMQERLSTAQSPSSVPLAPEEPLQAEDILWYAGPATAISDLRKIPGLVSFEDDEVKQINEKVFERRLIQAVVARKGPLVGKTAKEVSFRTRYGAAVIAVHRDGTRVQNHPGNISLRGGDVLLLEAGPTFISKNVNNQQSFALISEVQDSKPPRLNKLIPALLLAVVMLVVFTTGVTSLLVCALVTSVLMVCIGILSQQEVRDAVDWTVFITIASAFGIGIALTNSGLADLIATGLVKLGLILGIGDAGLYGSVYLGTVLISNVVTNNAAAALMFPIAMEAADQMGADPLLMAYNLMLAASASFMSPFGYTTNLLVYGPGGYKVKDFLYMGTPMQILLWVVTTTILTNTESPWYLSWVISSVTFVAILLVVVFPSMLKDLFLKASDARKKERT